MRILEAHSHGVQKATTDWKDRGVVAGPVNAVAAVQSLIEPDSLRRDLSYKM